MVPLTSDTIRAKGASLGLEGSEVSYLEYLTLLIASNVSTSSNRAAFEAAIKAGGSRVFPSVVSTVVSYANDFAVDHTAVTVIDSHVYARAILELLADSLNDSSIS